MPSLAVVASQLGVSRITLANALNRLSGEGFVRLTPHKEAFGSPLSTDDVEEIYTMRAALEGKIVAFAARRVTAADLADLRAANCHVMRIALAGTPLTFIRWTAPAAACERTSRQPTFTRFLTGRWSRWRSRLCWWPDAVCLRRPRQPALRE